MAYWIRRNKIALVGQLDIFNQSDDIYNSVVYFTEKLEAENIAIELAFKNKGNLYEVFDIESSKNTLTIRFGKE
jgi:hypothetical protein